MGNLQTCQQYLCCKTETPHDTEHYIGTKLTSSSQQITELNIIDRGETESRDYYQMAIQQVKDQATLYPEILQNELRINKLQACVSSSPKLRLKILSSTTLPRNSIITINALGSEHSFRSAQDGIFFVGCKKRSKNEDTKGSIINDFVIPLLDSQIANKYRGVHFIIFFDPDKTQYKIIDLGIGTGTFMRMTGKLILRNNLLISMGESHILINLTHTSAIFPMLTLSIYGGPCSGRVYNFQAAEFFENHITLGRLITCDLNIPDNLLSKVQCSIFYSNSEGWILIDGDIQHRRPSTNGTWIYLSEPYTIFDKMVFKSNNTLFQAKLIDQYQQNMVDRLSLIANHLAFPDVFKNKANLKGEYLQEPLSYYHFEELMGEELNAKRLAVRQKLEEKIAPMINQYYERAEFPMEIIPILREMNITSLPEPIQGVRQATRLEQGIITYELARIDASLATFVTVQIGLAATTIMMFGTPEQKQKYLPRLANFDIIGCWGLTEPNFGTDAASLQTSATPTQGGYVINGEKRWIGNAIISDIIVVFARNAQTKQIEGFIVDSKAQGVSIRNVETKLALRIVQNGQITLNNVFVPESEKLVFTNFENGPNLVLKDSRVMVPWVAVGMMAGIYERAVEYSRARVQFNSPIAAMQLTQFKLAKILGNFSTSFMLAWRSTQFLQEGRDARSPLTKATVSELGREAARLGREILGGNGILLDFYMMKYLADMEVVFTYEGSYDLNMLLTGKDITGVFALVPSFTLRKNK